MQLKLSYLVRQFVRETGLRNTCVCGKVKGHGGWIGCAEDWINDHRAKAAKEGR